MPARNEAIHSAGKVCEGCGLPVKLTTVRDITRKKFCSRSCSNRSTTLARLANLEARICRECGVSYKPAATTQVCCSYKCLTKGQVVRSYQYLNENPRAYIRHLLAKPGRKHIPVEAMLTLLEAQKGKCAVSGENLTFIKRTDGVKQHTNLSIDRINSDLGYEVENIQLVCAVVNIMKTVLTNDELRWWCQRIINTKGECDA